MLPAPSPIPADIAAAYNGALARVDSVRFELRWYATVPSTMDLAAEAVQAGAREGVVFCADEQTAGRGRRGREWSSPGGVGLYLSLVLRPVHAAAATPVLPLITLAGGVAVQEAIDRATGLVCELKWPNDVMIGRRKVAGILAEGFSLATSEQAVVLGVGINVLRAGYPPEVAERAVSLEDELGRTVDRAVLFEETLVGLGHWYDRLCRGEAGDILQAWRAVAPSARGARVEWSDDTRRGVTAGVDDTGALLVTTEHGIERVVAGEVRWL